MQHTPSSTPCSDGIVTGSALFDSENLRDASARHVAGSAELCEHGGLPGARPALLRALGRGNAGDRQRGRRFSMDWKKRQWGRGENSDSDVKTQKTCTNLVRVLGWTLRPGSLLWALRGLRDLS